MIREKMGKKHVSEKWVFNGATCKATLGLSDEGGLSAIARAARATREQVSAVCVRALARSTRAYTDCNISATF